MSRFKKIFITGASTGIGRQLALDYGRQGAAVWLLARSEDKLNSLAAEIQEAGGQAHVLVCDATKAQDLLDACQYAQEGSGGFDLVIANAGWGGKMSYPNDKNISVLDQVIALNYIAATHTLEYFAKFMAETRHGHLVGITSIAGYRGMPSSAAYSSTKAALSTYLEALRFSMKHFGVRVTDIRPGFVRTPMTAKNKVPMPFIMDVDRATKKIRRAIERGSKRFTFPWQMAFLIHIVSAIPDFLYDWIAGLAFGELAVSGRGGKSEENLPG